MRRLLVAGFAALAVLLGLVATTGVASAAPHDRGHDGDRGSCTLSVGVTGVLRAGVCVAIGTGGLNSARVPCVPAVAGHHLENGVCVADRNGGNGGWGGGHDGGGLGGGFGGSWHPGLPWGGPALYGHQIWVDANLGLDICGYSAGDYNGFLSRNAAHRDAILRALGASPMQRWAALHQSDCNSGLAVLPGGLNLVNGSYLNLDLLGLPGGGLQSVCSYADWNAFDNRLGGRFGGRFGSVRNHFGGNAFNVYRQLRVNARCTTVMIPSSTTIVQDPNTTYSASPTTDPSSGDAGVSDAPASSAPLPAIAPAKAPSTGGWDTASVLAHARVV